MSYWSHNPERYDQIIFDEMVRQGKATEDEDACEAVAEFIKQPDAHKLIAEAEADYWAGRIDAAMAHKEDC